ncbi:MAG TPA: carboxypeptidase regulatory-like domain-containing protein, partial [Acidimicrobiia bacterium]
ADGRLRARIPGLVLSTPNQVLTRNLTYASVGTVTGLVSDVTGQLYPGAAVTLQMTEGLRFAFDVKADATGRFLFPGVPVGNFTLSAARDGRTGTAQGRVNADNQTVPLNVQLATNSLIGTVFDRDGTTPAPGVTVYLLPARVGLTLTVNPNTPGVLATTTNSLGQFGFPIPTTDNYTLQAENGTDRGRTQVVITTIDPRNPVQANVTFLAKGTVSGVVKDSSGAPQAGAAVKVTSRGAFNNEWTTTTDSQGAYTVAGVFVGDITVTAQNTQTRLAGASSGRLVAEGDSLTLDVTLAATGRVTGQILKRDGSVLGTPVRIEISATFANVGAIDAPNGSSYQFDLVPVGDFTVTATETATGDKGISTSRIGAAGEVKTLNVRLVGQGTVHVTTVDEAGAPVAGAKVTVRTNTPVSSQATLDTGASGEATFVRVPAGDFTVSATKPAVLGTRSGSGAGTLIANQSADVSVTLVSRPVGTVKGIVFGPDGLTPRPGMVVRMTPEPTFNAYRTVTDGDGQFEFQNIEGGTAFTINARLFDTGGCNVDRIRAQATGVSVTEQDEVIERNLQMIGAGSVSGRVLDGAGVGVGGIRIRLTNPDPVYGLNNGCGGTAYETTSAADGSYGYPDIPAGNFTIIAENASRTLRAEGTGRVRFDGDAVTVDLELVDNAVTMPYTLLDANTMP